MASVCEVCGKKPSWGMSVSHSHRRTKRRWNPNIQRVRALVNGSRQAGQRLHRLPQVGQGRQGADHGPDRTGRLTPTPRTGCRASSRPTTRSPATASSCATPISPTTTSAADALEGSVFRMLRQGQRVIFDLDDAGRATRLRLGSEVDMETPGQP